MNEPFQLLSIRRKREKFYLVVNRVPIGYVDEKTLARFRVFLEENFHPPEKQFFEIHFPRLEQDDETHDMYRAIAIEVETEREACAHLIDLGVETAEGEGNPRDADFLRIFARMIRARSAPPVPEMGVVNKTISEAASAGERRGQAWGLWQAFEYSAQIAEQFHGELAQIIAAEIRKDAAEHNGNDWARVVLRAEMKGQARGAEIERERIAQEMEANPLQALTLGDVAQKIRESSPQPRGSYPFTEREIAAHLLKSIGDELWAIGRRNEGKTPGEGLALTLKTIAADMRQKAITLKKGGQNEESNKG